MIMARGSSRNPPPACTASRSSFARMTLYNRKGREPVTSQFPRQVLSRHAQVAQFQWHGNAIHELHSKQIVLAMSVVALCVVV